MHKYFLQPIDALTLSLETAVTSLPGGDTIMVDSKTTPSRLGGAFAAVRSAMASDYVTPSGGSDVTGSFFGPVDDDYFSPTQGSLDGQGELKVSVDEDNVE